MDVTTALQLLEEESAQLDKLVTSITPADWQTQTPAEGWSIADQIGHLIWTDEISVQAIQQDPAFTELLKELATSEASDVTGDTARERSALPPEQLLTRWREARESLAAALSSVDEGAQIAWMGPPMRPITMATARIMETWAHGLDVFDTLGLEKPGTLALAAVCRLGVRTRGFAYKAHGLEAPSEEVRVELSLPDGTMLEFGPENAGQRITGTAWAFAAVVTQRRNIADVDLVAEGELAEEWMRIAQVFAGPTTQGPLPGERVPNVS